MLARVLLRYALNNAAHLVELLFDTAKQLVLCTSSLKVVLLVLYLIVVIAIDVVHQEAKHLLVGNILSREGKVLQLCRS